MTKDKERDEALIAEVARAISRKVDSFGDTERIEQQRAQLEWPRYREHAKAAIDALLRGDEPAKPVDDEEPMVPRDVAESWKARADNLKEDRENLLSDLAIMMSKHVENWRRDEVQAIGAAISTRNWHNLEVTYNSLRDKIDAAIRALAKEDS